MLFHAFRVVYTVKDLDSHAKHGQSLKKRFRSMTEYLFAKTFPSRFVQVSESFFFFFFLIMALPDVMKGGTPYMGISPGRARPRTHQPGQEQERAHQHASSCGSARDLLGTGRMSLKKCVFGCKGMITLFSFPKEPSVT